MRNILVLCTGNSCRSQIAHGYLEHLTNKEKVKVFSAGIETHGVNPRAIRIMREDGIDISGHTSNHIDEYREIEFDHVITVCDNARENCPVFPSRSNKIHRNFPDPARATGNDDEIMAEFRRVRELIKSFCRQFVDEHPELI